MAETRPRPRRRATMGSDGTANPRAGSRLVAGCALLLLLGGACPVLAGDAVPAQQFGARGDGTSDDWWAIQQGIDHLSAVGGGILSLPPTGSDTYVIRQALRLRSNVTVRVERPETVVRCASNYRNHGQSTDQTGVDAAMVNRWGLDGCLIFGSVTTAENEADLSDIALDPLGRQGDWVKLARAEDASMLRAGDLVIAASRAVFHVGPEPIPTWGEMDRIEAIDREAGRVRLRYSAARLPAAAVLRPIAGTGRMWQRSKEDAASDSSIGLPTWGSWQAGILGGTWIARDETGADLPFSVGGGGLDCRIEPHAVSASHGLGYGNLFSHCRMSVDRETVSVTPLELAYLSSQNQVSIGTVTLRRNGRPFHWIVTLDEGSHDNTVEIGSLILQDPGVKEVVSMVAAQNNSVSIGRLAGAPISGSVVSIDAMRFEGDYPPTTGNRVSISRSEVGTGAPYVRFGGFSVTGNVVHDSRFKGLEAGVSAVLGNRPGTGNAVTDVDMQ